MQIPIGIYSSCSELEAKKHRRFGKVSKVRNGAKVILAVIIDIQDRLINGQTGIIKHI